MQNGAMRKVVYWGSATALAGTLIMGVVSTTLYVSATTADASDAKELATATAHNLEKLSGLVVKAETESARHRAAAQRNADMLRFCTKNKISIDNCPQEKL